MHENILLNLSLYALALPLFGFTTLLFFGKKIPKSEWLQTFFLFASLVLSIWIAVGKFSYYTNQNLIAEIKWIQISFVSIELGVKIDNIAAIMLIVVNLISFLVHLYSIEYMKGDKRYSRYFAYLGLFTFSMIGIVLTHNILMMYIFWELVGVSSYLLIGFWFEKKSSSDAAKKAFIVNRLGDIGMFIGMLILFFHYGTFTFDKIFAQISIGDLPFNSGAWLTATGILLFMGAVGKSAQFPLHVWLPDAMEGPTPVSALIHAATMVAAGVFMLVRIFVVLSADAMLTIAIVGIITSFVAATIALTQNDIKKILAYSTVSQLGFMVMAVGVGAYTYAFFHLVTHAFFKACLFLGSGSVIHTLHNEQDIRNMGGLRKKLPLTYYTFLISTLAITGVPLTSGFLSKDGLLAGTLAFGKLTGHWIIPIVAFAVALMTAFYMFRLVILTFHDKPRNAEKFSRAHESPIIMTLPLILLSFLSIYCWFGMNPLNAESGWFLSKWIHAPSTAVPNELTFDFMKYDRSNIIANRLEKITHSASYIKAFNSAHYHAMFFSLGSGAIGILLAFLMYQWKKINPDKLANRLKLLYNFSLNKWRIDELYKAVFVEGIIKLSNLMNLLDKNIIDGIVNGTALFTRKASALGGFFDNFIVDGFVNFMAYLSAFVGLLFRKLQTGKVQTYITLTVFSLILLFYLVNPF